MIDDNYWCYQVINVSTGGDNIPVLEGESWCLLTPLSVAAISGGGGWWVPTPTPTLTNNKSSNYCNKMSCWDL